MGYQSGVRWRIGLGVVLALLLAGWLGLAFTTSAGTDAHAFRNAAAKTAQGALSAVRTARLPGRSVTWSPRSTAAKIPPRGRRWRRSARSATGWPTSSKSTGREEVLRRHARYPDRDRRLRRRR